MIAINSADKLEKMNAAYHRLMTYEPYLFAHERVHGNTWDREYLTRVVFSFGWQQGEENLRNELLSLKRKTERPT